jgi:hypothetical protein
MGLGSIYAGIGLAEGLGGIPQAYTMGRRAAEESAMAALQRKSQIESLQNQKLTRERAIAEMQDKENFGKIVARLGALGEGYRKALEGEDVEVEEPVLKSTSEQMKDSLVGAVPKPSLDLSGKPVNLGGMGSPLGGTPYETKTKTVKQVDFDKLAEIKNKMAMGYQQAALLDPRYANIGEKAIQTIETDILKKTFASGLTGDTKTMASGLKALTGQEFEIKKEGDSFDIKAVGDLAPVKIKLEELPLLADPVNFVKYRQKYEEAQRKAYVAQQRLIYDRKKLVDLKLFPYVVVLDNGEFNGFPDKASADEYAQKMGAVATRNTEYDLAQARIEAAKSKKTSSSPFK